MKLVEIADPAENTGRQLIPIEDVDPVYAAAQMATEGMSDTEKFLARTGRVMGGTYRGIKQLIGGDTPEMAEDRLREQALADAQGNLGGGGAQVLGLLADPILAPLFAARAPASLLGWGLQGGAFGVAQGALSETPPEESRAGKALTTGATGLVLGPVVGKALNMASRGAVTAANKLSGADFPIPAKIPILPTARVSRNVADTVTRKLVPVEDIAPPVPEQPLNAQAIIDEYQMVQGGAKFLPEPVKPDIAPEITDELTRMGGEAGWAERGGRLIRTGIGASPDEIAAGRAAEVGDVVGRTKWIPRAEWFQSMRQDLGNKGLAGEQEIQSAVDKFLAGEKLTAKEKRTVEWMQDEAKRSFEPPDEPPTAWQIMTEEEKNAELDAIFGADTGSAKPAAAQVGARGAAQEVGFNLEGQTEAQITADLAARSRAAEQARIKASAPPPEDFMLSGSARPADEAAARGQMELGRTAEQDLAEFGPGTLGMNIAPSAVKQLAQDTMQAWTKYAGRPAHQLVKAYPGTSLSGISGMVGGWNSADDDATTVEKTGRAAAGFVMGALVGRGAGMIPVGGKNVSEWLSRGIINNYGRNADVVAAQEAARLFKSAAGTEWVELVQDVGKMDAGQRRALYQMMQGEAPQQADLTALNDRARATITKFGQMMVDTGMLDEATFLRNQAIYLHREYTSKLEGAARSGVSDKIAKFAASELRPRGVMFDVPEAQAQKYIDAGAEKWDTPKRGIVTLRRQLTKPEREALGEIEDAGYAIARTGQLMTHDLSVYKFYADLAGNPNVAQDINPGGWIQIKEGNVAGTKLKKFGNLEGKFVPQEVYDDLKQLRFVKQISEHPALKWYLNANSAWKAGKTALNPTVHVNNIISNTLLYDLSDASWSALGQAGRQMLRGGAQYEQAKSLGVFSVNFAQQELRGAAKAALEEFGGIQSSGSMSAGLNFARKTWDVTGGKMMRAYQGEDNVFRLGVFIDRLKKGMTPEEAAVDAKRWMIDYDINAPVIQAVRNTVLPFVSYTYRAVPLLTEVALEKPWKFAKWAALGFAINEAGEKWGGGDTAKERALMSSRDKGDVFGMPFFPPQMLKLPTQIGGTPQALDITRWIPGGDVMDVSSENKMIPFVPQPLQPGGMMISGVQAGLGFDQLTGKKLPGLGLSDAEDAKIKGKYLAQQFLPNNPLMPGSFAQDKIIRSAYGEPSPLGDVLPVWQAALQTVGVKIRPLDLNKMQMRTMYETKQDVEAIKEQILQARNDRQAGKMTEEQFQKYQNSRMAEAMRRVVQMQKRIGTTAGQ